MSNNHIQVFRKATPEAIDLIAALLEYTPTQRLSAIEAMCHPFFDEIRDPACRFPDSRHPNGASKEMPALFDFSRHGMLQTIASPFGCSEAHQDPELSIAPEMNTRLVPVHARKALAAQGLDLEAFVPLSKDEMIARLD